MFEKAVRFAHMLITQNVHEGDIVVDATMGNGHDTLFLAGRVGLKGKVYSFDIQEQALAHTRALLEENQMGGPVELILDGHQNMDLHIQEKVKLVVFNLGYLPGSDKTCSTLCPTTLTALHKALSLLTEQGLVLVVIYPGHPEGQAEREQLQTFAASLPQDEFNAFVVEFINHAHFPPLLLGIAKR